MTHHQILSGILCALLAIAVLFPANALAEKRVALVIGNGAYQHTTKLRNPANDARALSSALVRLGFTVVEGRDLTRAAFEEKLKDFAGQLQGADTALVFYGGHGLQVGGENWLLPIDANVRSEMDLDLGAIALTTILKTLEGGARVRLVFLDACRDNPMATQLAQGLGSRSTSVGRGLARIEASVGTLIAYSTQPGAIAADGAGAHSPFTEALLGAIETPGLEIRQMLSRVRSEVLAQTRDAQVPWDHSSLTGDFYFADASTTAFVAAAGPTAATPIQSSKNPVCRRAQERIDAASFWGDPIDGDQLLSEAESCLSAADGGAWGFYLRGIGRTRVNPEGALDDLSRAIAMRPDYVAAYLARANLLVYVNWTRAHEDMGEALRLSPANSDVLIQRGRLFLKRRDSEAAMTEFDRAVEVDPSSAEAHYGRGLALMDRRDYRGVIRATSKAIELEPRYGPSYFLRAQSYLATGDMEKADADFQSALDSSGYDIPIYSLRGLVYCGRGDYQRGINDFTTILSVMPSNAQALKGRAVCKFGKGDVEASLVDYDAALRVEPNDAEIVAGRGEVLARLGRLEEAISAYNRAMELKPREEWRVFYSRGLVYATVGNIDAARADLTRADQLHPNDPAINELLKKLGG